VSSIGEFVHHPQFSSIEELKKKVRHLPDGVGFLSTNDNPIWPAFFAMSPYAEFDFDMLHFHARVAPAELAPIALEFLRQNQFIAYAFDQADEPWRSEIAFAATAKYSSRRPLLLHFSSMIGDAALAFQEEHAADIEIVHIGPQFHCTRRDDLDRTLIRGMKILPLRKIDKLIRAVDEVTQLAFQRPTWIRFNLNCLAASQGGGVESWATGLTVADVVETFEWWVRQTGIKGLSIGTSDIASDRLAVRTATQIASTLIHAQTNRRIVNSAHGKK
jgi:hypothetical protein